MADKKLENKVNLDTTVSEQIADMQLMYLRQAALKRVLTYDEIKTLEILTKVKNTEVDKRQPKEVDPKKTGNAKLIELAKNLQLEETKENKDDKGSDPISKA